MQGIKASLVTPEAPLTGNTAGEVVTLRLTLEGISGLRDNTSRTYSKFFESMLKQVTEPIFEPVLTGQLPLPGL